MTYTLTKTITKQSEEAWVVFFNVSKSIDSVPDDRDNTTLYSENEKIFVQKYFESINENMTDYLGWNRSYVNDNSIEVVFTFDTPSSSREFYRRMTSQTPSIEVEALNTLFKVKKQKLKIPNYQISWNLADNFGNQITL